MVSLEVIYKWSSKGSERAQYNQKVQKSSDSNASIIQSFLDLYKIFIEFWATQRP